MRRRTMGSLFDGWGGFPLAGSRYGFEALWASEIELSAVAVTRKQFPEMKHLGDITKIDGSLIEPVEVVTFGSPCQDLSVAGNRGGPGWRTKRTFQGSHSDYSRNARRYRWIIPKIRYLGKRAGIL